MEMELEVELVEILVLEEVDDVLIDEEVELVEIEILVD